MKLTKEQEKEVLKEYNTYWDSYITGDVETMILLLDDDYNQIGSAESEVFFNKNDAIKFLYETIDQVAGKAEMRNRIIKVEPLDEYVLVNDLFDIYVLIETEWSFYSKFRASTLMQKKEGGWKFIHQHSSMPDTRTQKGENIAIEKISAENLQLREAVKRRTIELEQKNRELEIEASLGRVRAVAMNMLKTDELMNVAIILHKEIKLLGFTDVRNTIINIFNDKKEKFLNYDYSDYGISGINEVSYNSHPLNKEFVDKMRKVDKAFMMTELTGNDLDEWRKWRISEGQMPDSKLDQVNSIYYYEYSIDKGSIGISTFEPITEEQLEILQKFRNVFNLAYQHFSDLKKAEEQAREAQIEAALERVRSRSMAMHNSDELKEVIQVVYEQFVQLNILIEHTGFIMDYKARDDMNIWLADQQGAPSQITIPYFDSAHWNSFNEAKEKGMDFFVNNLTFEEKNRFYKKLFKYIPETPEEGKEFYLSCPGLAISTVLLENVGLYIENFSGIPYSDEENNTLMRFGNVFQQTYSRFLDLQKAEAQAREAQIEAALERVRSKTMAMHNSHDVGVTVITLFDEVLKLGLDKSIRCGIGILEGKENMETWSATSFPDGEIDLKMGMLDMTIHPMLIGLKKAWKRGESGYSYEYIGDDVIKYYNALNNEPEYPFHVELDTLPEKEFHNSFFFPEGILFAFTLNPISEEAAKVLNRFAQVFGQTYRRYLDLQKAEAQAREAKIEVALERVRSKAMAMHSSEDLALTVDVFFTELKNLKVTPRRCGVTLINEESHIADLTVTTATEQDKEMKIIGKLKLAGHPILDNVYNNWKLQKEYHTVLHGDEIKKYYQVMNPQIEYPDFSDDEAQYGYYFYFKEGGVFAWTENELTERELEIFRRYTSVLSLTYRRYIDLKEAEAQAREAKIEAALEKVRARTMAMHKSDELADTAAHLFRQLSELGIQPYRCNIGIVDAEKDKCQLWSTTNKGDVIPLGTFIPLTETPSFINIYAAWKKKLPHSVMKLVGKDRLEMIKYFIKFMPYAEFKPEEMTLEKISQVTSIFNIFNFKQGFINIHTNEDISETDLNVIQRFTTVFEQTYTRFLDLKNAEAQAREAQIEVALERVRARTMAMHKSSELTEVGNMLFQQMRELGINAETSWFWFIDLDTDTIEIWVTHENKLAESIKVEGSDLWTFKKELEAWKNHEPFFKLSIPKKEAQTAIRKIFGIRITNNKDSTHFHLLQTRHKYGFLGLGTWYESTKEEMEISSRFAGVFEQTYTRFLDLQKAEAQSREAKIEAALERVRSKTMAMHKSDDLTSAVATVFEELRKLGLKTIRCGVGIFDGKNRKVNVWTSSASEKSDSVQVSGDEKLEGHSLLDGIYDSWQRQQDYSYVLKGEDLTKYYNVVADSNLPVKAPEVNAANAIQYYHCVMFPAGGLFAFRESEFSAEAIRLMRRFADVFHLTFIRHLDLKNAEAQNKIIQAENERKTLELEEARELQLSMLPKELPNLPNLDIAVYMQTATEVGGDYYDFQVGIDGTLTTIIGDATGHGMKAGTVVTITKSLFNSMAANENILSTFDKISQVIKGMKFRQLAMCLIMMKIRGNRLSISSAAMPPALIYRAKNKTVEEILLKGMPLGTMKKFPYKKIEGRLNSGDRILLYSDGLPELANDKDQMFGYDRIQKEFQSVGEKEPEDIVDHLKNSASRWLNGKDPDDDVTFVVIKVK